MKRKCANCAYWCQYLKGGSGECRRHAPAPMYSMTGDKPGPIWWPQTLASFWCGDFETRNHPAIVAEDTPADDYVVEWNKLIASSRNPEKFEEKFQKKIQKKIQKGNK